MGATFDCAVVGSGIAGATSALVLSRLGLRVLVIERSRHPRFAIGEGMLPTGTLTFDHLARTYDLPELRQVTHYPGLKELGLGGWPKMHGWFGHHSDGEPLAPGSEHMITTPGLPIGPDVHVLRSDVDAFLTARLGERGVEYVDGTEVTSCVPRADGVTLALTTGGRTTETTARFVLDCSGHPSVIARELGLRDSAPALETDTRAIFSHFAEVPMLEDVLARPSEVFGKRRDAGTIHHVFRGGWFWVIRFDNGLASVGLVLDRREHPERGLEPETELRAFLDRFPVVREQLGGARPVRPLVKTGRVQITSHAIAGDRYLLAPHAASFVDPLFSSGILLTAAFVARAAPILREVFERDAFEAARLAPIARCYEEEIRTVDRLVHGAYRASRHTDVFKQYWRCWVYATIVQYYTYCIGDPARGVEPLGLYGSSLPTWRAQLERMYAATGAGGADTETAAAMKATMDAWSEPYDSRGANWALSSDEPCHPFQGNDECIPALLEREPALRERARGRHLLNPVARHEPLDADVMMRYWESKGRGGAYHEGVDFIEAMKT